MFKILNKLQFWQKMFCPIKCRVYLNTIISNFLLTLSINIIKKSYKNAKNQNSKKENIHNR